MVTSELKNYTLANYLQYDVSYISKWVSGKMLPSEKNLEWVISGISDNVVAALAEKSRKSLYQDYQVDNDNDLKAAIYDNLIIEYNYVKELKTNIGADIAPQTVFFPELSLSQFVSKMKHPVLRKVRSLDVMALIDIMSLDYEYRLKIVDLENENISNQRDYPGVHFSMLINLSVGERERVLDAIFLMNLLSKCSNIDLQLYGSEVAHGKAMFLVKDMYALSGVLVDGNCCMAVTASEDNDYCNKLYYKAKSLCSRELLLFRKTKISDMISNYDYMHSLLSTNLRWVFGHMTEHFLPDDVFEEMLTTSDYCGIKEEVSLRKVQSIVKKILQKSNVKIVINEFALADFAVSGRLNFYNNKVYLSEEQRIKCIKYILDLLETNEKLELKSTSGKFVEDYYYAARPCVFMADTISYIRLESRNSVAMLNGTQIKSVFSKFFEEIWESENDVVVGNVQDVKKYIYHIMQSIEILSK